MTSTTRTTVRAVALGALAIAMAAGCSGAADDGGAEASKGGGAGTSASDAGGDTGASDDGGAAAATDDEAGESVPADTAAEHPPESADLATEELPVPAEDAVRIAAEAAGGGEPVSISIDHDDRRGWVWEIEVAFDGSEHEVDIDAATGEIIEHDQDDDAVDDPIVDLASPMSPEEAIERAQQKHDGRVSGWELDSDKGVIRYEIEFEHGNDDVEVDVDVETGEVRIDD